MNKKSKEVEVGVFVIFGFIFLTLILFFVSGVYLFRSGYTIDVLYGYVSILNKGAPVRMAGVKVGEISSVKLFYDEGKQQSRVRIKLFIEKGVEIRENYQFTIRGTHILSEPHIEITPKPGNFPVLHKGDVVEGSDLVSVESLIEKAHEIMSQLADVMGKFKADVDGEGTVKDLKTMIKNFSELSTALNSSVDGGSESGLSHSMKNIESSTASLDEILGKVRKGEGTLGKLLMDDGLYKEMDAFVKDVRAHPWKLLKKGSSGKGKDSGGGRKWYFLYLI